MIETRTVVITGMALLAVVIFALGAMWTGVRATEADRRHRTARSEACRTVEDETLRTLCLVQGPGR